MYRTVRVSSDSPIAKILMNISTLRLWAGCRQCKPPDGWISGAGTHVKIIVSTRSSVLRKSLNTGSYRLFGSCAVDRVTTGNYSHPADLTDLYGERERVYHDCHNHDELQRYMFAPATSSDGTTVRAREAKANAARPRTAMLHTAYLYALPPS